jgi:hypothetical protein
MGSRKGVKNKRTIYREQRDRAAEITAHRNCSVAEIVANNGASHVAESLNALGEALGVFLIMARTEADPEKRCDYYRDVVMVAEKLAPFRYPRLASIHTSATRKSALERPGVIEREIFAEVMAEIMAEIRESGEVPRSVKAYLEAHGNGGLANRNGG